MDCGAAAMSILLQALDLGYGTCWCGVYPYEDLVMQMQAVLSTKAIPVAIIALGVPAEKPAQKGFYDETRVSYLK